MMKSSVVYFDNAATSYPKPDVVWEAVSRYGKGVGANPGRSGHRLAVEAARTLFSCRVALAELLGVGDPERIVLTKNATEAANHVVFGLLWGKEGGNVVATALEHNAVARPLRFWCRVCGVELRVVGCGPDGMVDPADILELVDGRTIAVFVNHASNVSGAVTPFEEVALKIRPLPLVLDTTQTLGGYPFSLSDFDNVIPFFTGHKGLLGPQGTGGFYLPEGYRLEPLLRGGTGSNSESDEQPDFLPDSHESGTLNMHGISGLLASINWIRNRGIEGIRRHELELLRAFVEGASSIKRLVLYGGCLWDRRVAVVSFNIEGMDPAEVARILDTEYGIASRPGLHCAPWAHRALGTFPIGTVRFSFGVFNTLDQVEYALDALERIAGGGYAG